MPFQTLPTELVQHILHAVDLEIPDSRQGLVHLSRCSKRFHQISTPVLFGTLIQTRTQALPCFLRSILTNPSLGQHTRVFRGSAATSSLGSSCTSLLCPSQKAKLHSIIQAVTGGDADFTSRWIDDIVSGVNYDAVIAVIFCSLPNLEVIHLGSYERQGGYSYTQYTLRYAAKRQAEHGGRVMPPYSMCRLANVRLSYGQIDRNLNFCDPFDFARPRSVRTFACERLAGDSGHMSPDFSSDVQDLTLDSTAIQGITLEHILYHCRRLRRFKYQNFSSMEENVPFAPWSVFYGLTYSEESLEEVVIWAVSQNQTLATSPQDWSRFTKLERMDVTWYALRTLQGLPGGGAATDRNEGQQQPTVTHRSTRMLPPALRILQICDCDTGVIPFIRTLISMKEDHTPSLQTVVLAPGRGLDLFESPRGSGNIEKADLVDLCASCHVDLTVMEQRIENY